MKHLFLTLTLIGFASMASAQEDAGPDAEPPMTLARLTEIILAIDEDASPRGNAIEFTVDDIPVLVVTDPVADRMRAMVPIRSAEGLEPEELMRMMQANFDSALDARYAVAQGRLWGVFIHPLSPLEQDQFLSAMVQTVNVARTYGQSYSGGAQVFGGGDSGGIYRELLEELRKGQSL
ncbi:hypothetical protein [uncultured Roseobacter sp.]|uniref:hypothetical protein n=1 Tax=uncultured Roseobacter sp. TaxID=114847 RepID=UPI00260D86BF|nr:hypothetical protein [uncultured Roseobacter sp.]